MTKKIVFTKIGIINIHWSLKQFYWLLMLTIYILIRLHCTCSLIRIYIVSCHSMDPFLKFSPYSCTTFETIQFKNYISVLDIRQHVSVISLHTLWILKFKNRLNGTRKICLIKTVLLSFSNCILLSSDRKITDFFKSQFSINWSKER